MSPEFFVLLFLGGIAAIAFVAYNMGWEAGHSIHHSDDGDSPEVSDPPPTLYV